MFPRAKLFGKNGWTRIAGEGWRSTTRLAFLAGVPKKWRSIRDLKLQTSEIVVRGPGRYVRLPAARAGQ
jgi:hypothetical protein